MKKLGVFFFLVTILFLSKYASAAITVQSVSGANAVWSGYLETYITFCNKRSSDETLSITYKSTLSGEALLVDVANKTLWQKPKVRANDWVTIKIPWSQVCSSMGNRKCRNPQYYQFKFGISSGNNNLLDDFHVLYVQIQDRCNL